MRLFWQHFRAQFSGLLVWILSGSLLAMAVAGAGSALGNGAIFAYMEKMPPYLQKMVGYRAGLGPLDSYVAVETGWFSVLLAIYAVLLALSIVSREVDRRTIDFLLALPVRRSQIIVTRGAVAALNTALLGGAMWATLCGRLLYYGLHGTWGAYALLILNQWLIAMAVGALALLSSIWMNDYASGVKLWLGIAVGSFFLDYIMRAANLGRAARAFIPFSYIDAIDVIAQRALPWVDVLVLAGVATVSFALTIPAFDRKQITL